ncbi:hypothetical protein B5C34_02350 [Pacificimonas flava]|uniref:Cytochrome c domain-containing protein n=2 Tax=Pacificimonas TaxID=1960290 RepID=A0A219B262_9SPHN|nr:MULTISPECIES: cytochrome c family protein [Pacificimonas]MBZ6377938.1 cytochrome c family protein [Pacificimonas aurantium]OWV32405.1 hypothetical protein B5C34_02350 [Pacificimonas flava]
MDSFEWNKIIGWVLAAAIAVLGLSIVSGAAFDTDRPEEMGFFVDVPEEAGAAEDEVDPMVELALAMQQADPARGEAVFKKCATCHTIEQGGANKQGPNLWAVVGRDVGSHAGFAYSSALEEEPGNWDWEKLNAYIESPRSAIPGNVMSFAGLSDVQDRANLFAYLHDMGGQIDLPAPPLPEELAAEDPEGTGPEAAKAEDVPEADLADAQEVPESNIGGPAAENQDTTDADEVSEGE